MVRVSEESQSQPSEVKPVDWEAAYFKLRNWFLVLGILFALLIAGFTLIWWQASEARNADYQNYVDCMNKLPGARMYGDSLAQAALLNLTSPKS